MSTNGISYIHLWVCECVLFSQFSISIAQAERKLTTNQFISIQNMEMRVTILRQCLLWKWKCHHYDSCLSIHIISVAFHIYNRIILTFYIFYYMYFVLPSCSLDLDPICFMLRLLNLMIKLLNRKIIQNFEFLQQVEDKSSFFKDVIKLFFFITSFKIYESDD